MYKYIIVDDENIAHDIIKGYCDLLPNFSHSKSCYDAIEALDFLRNNKVDLIFLDINMPKLKGFDFLRSMSSYPKVIVTTAYQEYALEGYELQISDYLLKPFSFERFLKAINRAQIPSNQVPKTLKTTNTALESTVFLKVDKKYVQIRIGEIQFLEANGNYTKINTMTDTLLVREKISSLIEILPKEPFLQVHKSYVVSSGHIKEIEGNRMIVGKSFVPIGKTYKLNILNLLK